MNNIIIQKHNNTAKTETMFVSSATDTNIAVIVIATNNTEHNTSLTLRIHILTLWQTGHIIVNKS